MSKWNRKEFFDFIIENDVIGFFKDPITLKSGRKSYWYVNWRNIAEDVFLIDKLTDYILEFVREKKLNQNCIYGVPEGATKIALLTQYKWAISQPDYQKGKFIFSMGRGNPKDHGAPKDRYFLGIPKDRTIVLEDVTTTGSSLIKTIKTLKALEIKIMATIGLTNRNELRKDNKSVQEKIQEFGIPYYSMSEALDLLPKLNPPLEIQKHIITYFRKYGEREISFRESI
jgi:orotate phosphoribosyltransferase